MNPHGGQDWVGFAIVLAAVILAVALDNAIARFLLWRESRANRRAMAALRATVTRCPACGSRMHDDHEIDDDECRALQMEREVRAEMRAKEWSA